MGSTETLITNEPDLALIIRIKEIIVYYTPPMFRNSFSRLGSGRLLFPLITFLFSANFLPVSVILGHFQEPVGEAKLGLVSPSPSAMIKHKKHYKSRQKVKSSTDTRQCCQCTQHTNKALACDWLTPSGKRAHWFPRFPRAVATVPVGKSATRQIDENSMVTFRIFILKDI